VMSNDNRHLLALTSKRRFAAQKCRSQRVKSTSTQIFPATQSPVPG
jgi:hypothetical protein